MVLIDKRPSNFALKISVDYVGKKIKSDKFLIGYGLDLNEIGRNLPEIYEINKKEINEIIKKSEL